MDIPTAHRKVDHFRAPKRNLGVLDADDASRLIMASSDIAMVLDAKGVIRDIAFGDSGLGGEGCQSWIGKALVDTVTVESRPKVEELIAEAQSDHPRWRQVNHPTARGSDVPVRYTAVRIVGKADRTIVMGRDLRSVASLQQRLVNAQMSLEREYAKLRQSETRYRLLFDVSSEAVLVVEGAALKISEANAACGKLVGRAAAALQGARLESLFDGPSAKRLIKHLDAVSASGRGDEIKLRLSEGKRDVVVGVSGFRQDGSGHFLIRLLPADGSVATIVAQRSHVIDVIERLPDAFVVTDPEQRIISANGAFVDLAQAASIEQVRGEPIDRWLGRQSVDVGILFSTLREHGTIRAFSTVLRGQYGVTEPVEVAGAAVLNTDIPCFGLSIRVVQRRAEALGRRGLDMPRSVEQLTELVGQVALKDLVRESTDLIEKLCIEAALELTGDNRASAAEMLGLSRQGLYSKLRRYGIDDVNGI